MNPLQWLLWSRARFMAVLAAVAAVILMAAIAALTSPAGTPQTAVPGNAEPTASHTPLDDDGGAPTDTRVPDNKPNIIYTAKGFIDAWLSGRTTPTDRWLASIHVWASPILDPAMNATNREAIPDARWGSATVTNITATSGTADVTLTNGSHLIVIVTFDGQQWLVTDLAEGTAP
ncbi:MAG TPA: hypothetical protein VFP72_23660 [Kineosporiaceae bacterium]|nr:hypothetical protein [Kineosporiaceae bacterium]